MEVEDPDLAVIEACLGGDKEAYAEIVRRYQTIIHNQMRWYARDTAACEELVHDVFVQAYLSLGSYSRKAPFRHWLRKIASHLGYRYIRDQKQSDNLVKLEDWDAASREPEAVDAEKATDLLYGLLARLPADDRMVLTLMYFEELGTREIADRMGWNRAMVKMRVYRAKKKLKQIVEDEGLTDQYIG